MRIRILKKEADNILVAASKENVRVGDYILVSEGARRLVLQIYDERYLDVEGIEEEIAREEVLSASAQGVVEDPLDLSSCAATPCRRSFAE